MVSASPDRNFRNTEICLPFAQTDPNGKPTGGLAYGNCARGTSGSQNRGVLSVFFEVHEMHWVLVSGYGSESYN